MYQAPNRIWSIGQIDRCGGFDKLSIGDRRSDKPSVRARHAAAPVLLTALSFAVNARVVAFPYIQDDWGYLESVSGPHGFETLLRSVVPHGPLYRPLGIVYFWLLAHTFGQNALGAHVVGLVLHTATGLLVAVNLERLTGRRLVASSAAALYLVATSVTVDPLLWASGFLDLGGMFLAMVALWLALDRRSTMSAIALAGALLCKESTAFVVPIVVAWSWRRQLGWRAVVPHAAVMTAWAALKAFGTSPLELPEAHPYRVAIFGPHVLENLERYARWAIQSVAPLGEPGRAFVIVTAAVVSAGATFLFVRERSREACGMLALWMTGGTVLFLLLPNHSYRYYLLGALPAILALALMIGHDAVESVASTRTAAAAIITMTVASASSSAWYLREATTDPNLRIDGTNGLVARARTVEAVRDTLQRLRPSLPAGSILLFADVDIWAFDQHAGPRLWYGDPTLRVYDVRDVKVAGATPMLVNAPEGQIDSYVRAAAGHAVALDARRLTLVARRGNDLVVRDWTP